MIRVFGSALVRARVRVAAWLLTFAGCATGCAATDARPPIATDATELSAPPLTFEKPNIQALGRKHPDLPMRPGYPLAREFEYVRHGVLHLFGAFNVRSGRVDAEVYERKTRFEFIDFLERLAWRYRQGRVHAVVDNASYHSTPEVKAWVAAHPRFVFHFTPTHSSWLNQIECWFSILAKKAVARGVFDSKRQLRAALLDFVVHPALPVCSGQAR
jgi:transposase